MPVPTLKMKDLQGLSEKQKRRKIREFLLAPRPTKEEALENVNPQIKALEEKFQITSNEMEYLLKTENIKEDHDICKWLMLIILRNRILKMEDNHAITK